VVTIGLVLLARRRGGRVVPSARQSLALSVVAVLAILAYFDFGQYPKFGTFSNPHDLSHYYLGSKYSHELGYLHLYPAIAVAQWENSGGRRVYPSIRMMQTYKYKTGAQVVHEADAIRQRFSPARWTEFKRDVGHFDRELGRRLGAMFDDMGYNATPVWTMIARPLTSSVDADDSIGMFALVTIDLLLIAAMCLALRSAFGTRAALLFVVFFGTSFWMSYTHIRGGLLRLDWLAALVVSGCMLEMKRYRTAGALLAYAAMVRVFPAVFIVGLVGRALWEWKLTGRVDRRYVDLFLAFAGTVVLLFALSVLSEGGLETWQAFVRKIGLHNRWIPGVRVGFKSIFLMLHSMPRGGFSELRRVNMPRFEELTVIWWSIQAVVVAVTMWVTRGLEDREALAMGYVPVFFLGGMTFYYHVAVAVTLLLFIPRMELRERTAGLVGVLGISLVLLIENQFLDLGIVLSFTMSWLLLALVSFMTWIAWRQSHRHRATSP
jgi:hypothetical protein